MFSTWRCSGFLAAALVVAVAGCDNSPDPGSDASVDAGSVDGGSGDSVSLVIAEPVSGSCLREVARLFPGVSRGCDTGAGEWLPIGGALVALDAPDGTRHEGTSGADGRVTLTGIDWSAGDHVLTAYADGHIMMSFLGVDAAWLAARDPIEGDPGIWLAPFAAAPPAAIAVTGTATGLTDPSGHHFVNSLQTPLFSEWQGAGSESFAVNVASGAPFILQGIEADSETLPSGQGHALTVHRVAHQMMPASTTDVSGVTLDFAANELPTHTASYSCVLPTRADSPVRDGGALAFVVHEGSLSAFGWAQQLDISADGNQFDITSVWVEPTFATSPYLLVRVMARPAMLRLLSAVTVPGYPTEGMTVPVPFDQPVVTTVDARHPIEVEWFDADVPVTGVTANRDDGPVWSIFAGPNATSVSLPMPPTGVGAGAFAPETLAFYVFGAEEWPDGPLLKRLTRSPDFLLDP